MASAVPDPQLRLRDLALLTLLYDCGLRREEACAVQLRDLDFGGGMLIVRNSTGGMPDQVILTRAAGQQLRDYLRMRVPQGLPPIGSDAEREALFARHAVTVAGQSWLSGMSPDAVHWRIGELGRAAAAKLHDQARRKPGRTRARQLSDLATRLAHVTPHQLRHGLASRLRLAGRNAAYIHRALRHTRASTSLKYGRLTDDDVRQALEESELTPCERQ